MRRRLLLLSPLALCACHHDFSEDDVSIAGLVPNLALNMTEAQTGKPVTEADFAGKLTLLYFGYTNCPDVCPATLYNLDRIFKTLGDQARQIQVLFVTVDPDRDTLPTLAQYTGLFGNNVLGLRGTADELYALARRYRVVFTVVKTPRYEVTHSAAVFVFNAKGAPQFIITGLDTDKPDLKGIAADLSYALDN